MDANMDVNTRDLRGVLACSACTAFLLFCEWFFFRNIIMTDGLIGDYGDGRLTMLITEHWFHVFSGKAAVPDLGIFYPATNTLAYSDMLLGYGIIHSMLRSIGMDIFYAYKATLMLVHLMGTFTTFYLLKRSLRTSFTWALFGTVAFSFTSTYSIHFGHTQLAAISILPLVVIFVTAFFKNLERRATRTLYAVLSILTLALILYTSWYIAFFTALFTVTCILLLICTMGWQQFLSASKNFLKQLGPDLVFYIIFAAALTVPFGLLSLPVLRMSGGFGGYGYRAFSPEFIDIINVSTANWLLGPLMRRAGLDHRGYSFEVMEGFNIVLLFAFAVLAYRVHKLNAKEKPRHYPLYVALFLSVVIGIFSVIRLSSNGISLWLFVYKFFPAGRAIRAVGRYFFYLSLPMAVVTAVMGDCLWKAKKRSVWTVVLLLVLVFVANIHIDGVSSHPRWTRQKWTDFINGIAAPPNDCKVFCIVNPGKDTPPWAIQLDAHQIADRFGINTINGYSGNSPAGWGGIWEAGGDRSAYEGAVSRWILRNGLENVYAYDEGNNVWAKFNATVQD